MSSFSNDDREQGHTSFIRGIYESRETAREHLIRAQSSVSDPMCSTRNVTDDPSSAQQAHSLAHAAVMNYYSDLLPYSGTVSKLWRQELYQATRPVDGQVVDGGSANIHGETPTDAYSLKQEPVVVSLESLSEKWRMERIRYTVNYSGREDADMNREVIETVYVPVAGLVEVYDQLNRCLAQLGLAAEIELLMDEDSPTQVPDHIRENAPAYADGGAE